MGRRTADAGPNGFAVVDKAAGWTSHDVVARARKVLDTRKVGHSGTLDPPATGVLVLGVGRGTKLLRFITELPKSYTATFRLGVETATLDAEGEVTATHEMAGVTLDHVRGAAAAFVGPIEQIPPMVSAVKIGGRRLHELAREGIEVPRPPRPVTVYELVVDAGEVPGDFEMRVRCSSGTYVRTLAADIGARLGGGAHVRTLRRTAVGSFTEHEARPVDDIELLTLADGWRDRPTVTATGDVAGAVRHGKVLEREVLQLTGDGPWAVLDEDAALLAVYEPHVGTTAKPAAVVATSGS